MRIAIVNQPRDGSLPPQQSSLAIWSYQVARRLSRSCEVVVYGRKVDAGQDEEILEGVRYRHVSTRFEQQSLRLLKRFLRFRSVRRPLVTSWLYCMEYARNVAIDLRERQCGFVMLFNYSQFVPVIRRLNPEARIALNMQCEWLTQFDPRMLRRRIKKADAITGCSDYIAGKIRARFPGFRGPCRALFNGVDVERFDGDVAGGVRKPAAPKRLLFVGRVSPEKGLHVLIDAFGHVLERHPEAELEIIGGRQAECPRAFLVDLAEERMVSDLARFYDGRGYFAHLQQRMASLRITPRVTFCGFIPHAETVGHYHAADVLINPSLSEAFGMSLAEAMACGVPVVASRIGGMPEVVEHGKTGLLVEPDNAEALAEAILTILDDPELGGSMGCAGRERAVRLFSWDKIAEDMGCLCNDVSTPGSRA